jgi:hypothetical protein
MLSGFAFCSFAVISRYACLYQPIKVSRDNLPSKKYDNIQKIGRKNDHYFFFPFLLDFPQAIPDK